MNQLLEKIKLWILGAYDKTVDFCREKWEEQRLICIAVLALVLLIILLLILLPSLSVEKPEKVKASQTDSVAEIEMEPFLSIPSEPYIEDDYVYTRDKVTRWSESAVNEWFSEPDEEMLDELKKANDKLIDDMMEVVP
ncbi:MAG: hypothetical protein KBT02_05835 [Treponema sp.]|nr:hypothetical protein [Candidatus Treponema caballi]